MVAGDGSANVELYDYLHDAWTETDPLPVPGNFQTQTLLATGQVLVTGGGQSEFNGPPESVIETYGSVAPPPTLVVTNTPILGVAPLTVHFTSPATDSSGNAVTNWNWTFGDGANSGDQSPSHTYTNAGTFTPSLAAYDNQSAAPLAVTGLEPVTVTNDTLTVSAGPYVGAVPLTVQFTSPAQDGLGDTVTNWSWDFGDGSISSAQSPSHVYQTVGVF